MQDKNEKPKDAWKENAANRVTHLSRMEERFLLLREENVTEHGADRLYVRTYDPDHQGDRGEGFSRAHLAAKVVQGYRVFVELPASATKHNP